MTIKLVRTDLRNTIFKNRALEDVEKALEEVEINMTYDDYVKPMILWATKDVRKLARELDVERVVPKGSYIMGLFGGEKKKGKQKYAGLVVEEYSEHNNIVCLKLFNLRKIYEVPVELMNKYSVDIYKLHYAGYVNPFKCKPCNTLLSGKGDSSLKDFLRELVKINLMNMESRDKEYLEILINELKTSIDLFRRESYYVIYRCQRMFTACVPEDLEKAVSESHTAYIECRSLKQAHYYVAVLNYLVYKAMELKRSFIRSQFARPLIAIVASDLTWNRVSEEVRSKVSELSEKLSQKLVWRKYSNQKEALENLLGEQEFRDIVELLDKNVNKDKLIKALKLVSTS